MNPHTPLQEPSVKLKDEFRPQPEDKTYDVGHPGYPAALSRDDVGKVAGAPGPGGQAFTAEQLELIRATVAKGATNDELKLFLYQCKRLGLDALIKQIHFVKYGNNPGTTITGIDGFRIIAHRTGKLSGIKRGAIHDEKGALTGAWAEVYRSDWTHPAREEAPLSEYNKGSGNWLKMPETMIKKVAEAAALRMAFPSDLSGVYAQEEMDQASDASVVDVTAKPNASKETPSDMSLTELSRYRVVMGKKYRGKTFAEIPTEDIAGFSRWLREQPGKTSIEAEDFLAHADAYLEKCEKL